MATSSSFVQEEAKEDAKEESKTINKAKKKVVRRMPQQEVDFVLSYDVGSDDIPDMCPLGEKYPYLVAWARALDIEMAEISEKQDREMLQMQKDYKQQLRAKGYVTYMAEVDVATDDDDEEEEAAAAVAPRGRRRFRRGVLKRGMRIKKLN
ncbi:uncharacterized protein LOC112270167 [Brachypodium distachyon]|uniref:Uncharacterized protein n=1 Tax=Brachypodium distachyon TaxID=15368 RepID=I1H0F0_BRADI|nr:uncharacterized protein LOC112270167 [Brachypodium distachyon]PNT76372.1 hypothetical protein BRADI_1g47523v3 [Brachypodium distachyon]|eukprot:XP_024313751.1 uncharacterized protein LOC112270167 [Brachypodium distachyon]